MMMMMMMIITTIMIIRNSYGNKPPEGTKRATSANVQLPCLRKDLRTGLIPREIVNFLFAVWRACTSSALRSNEAPWVSLPSPPRHTSARSNGVRAKNNKCGNVVPMCMYWEKRSVIPCALALYRAVGVPYAVVMYGAPF